MEKIRKDKEQKELLEDFDIDPDRQPNAYGGIAGTLRLNRTGFKVGGIKKGIDLVAKYGPEFKKFADMLFIKASNMIRQGKGAWKGLTEKQMMQQHDNLTQKVNTFQKEGTLEGMEQYFGINAEKAFVEAQAKVSKPKIDFSEPRIKEMFKKAGQKGTALSDASKRMGYDPTNARSSLAFDDAITGGMEGFPAEIREQIIRAKYGDVVDTKLLNQMIADTDPQHLAVTMGTVEEGLKMQEMGMGADEIVETIQASLKRKPSAEGGRVGMAKGGLPNILKL